MPIEPPPFEFTAEGGEYDGHSVTLAGPDLPHLDDTDHVSGGTVRETATRYPSGAASIQRHGWKYEPVKLVGVLEDAKARVDGHALDMRDRLERLCRNGGLVHLQYGSDERWGTMDCKFTEETRGEIAYELTFRPYFDAPPESVSQVRIQRPPNDAVTAVNEYLASLTGEGSEEPPLTDAEEAPDEVDDSLAQQIMTAAASVAGGWERVVSQVNRVSGWVDLAQDAGELVTQPARSALRGLDSIRSTLEGLSSQELAGGEAGTGQLTAADWSSEIISDARRARAALVSFLLELDIQSQPEEQQTYVARQGDTLQSVASRELGDWSRWTDIADLNDLDRAELETGQEIRLPA